MRTPLLRRPSAGFTLVEMLIAMTMTAAVMGAAFSLFRSQSQALGANEQRYDQMQDARGTLEAASRLVRTMGAGVPNNQPVLVYASDDALAFNTDFIEADTVDTRWAAYFNAQTPTAETVSWDVSAATVIPTSAYTYPTDNYLLGSGVASPAETVILYFAADSSTARTDDYILWQRVNAGTPTMIARNILAHPSGLPFFQYLQEQVNSGNDTLITEPAGNLPLERRVLTSGITSADSANYVRPDSVRAVRLNIRFTNGLTGTAERFRDVQTMVQTPNNGKPIPSVCGRAPVAPTSFAAIDTIPGSGRVWLSWNSSVDQDAGEVDVLQYIVYRKLSGATAWSDPLAVVRRIAGQGSYSLEIGGNTPGTAYTFGVSAQDCTPSESTITTLNITTSTGP
ncbi:MAG TPA: prepilin-type N-terminal cleavage/methylation domain-containing protein [Gemmatimonadales bacterium]|jgi:prepilin-type N-terminal cleavage/methylation domain-containing protein